MGNTATASEKQTPAASRISPSARTVAKLMTTGRENVTNAETVMTAAIETGAPALVEAREIVADFQAMFRVRRPKSLASSIERASQSLVASLANGVRRDEAAVRVAILSTWSNGQPEGQITRLQLVKRKTYGRG